MGFVFIANKRASESLFVGQLHHLEDCCAISTWYFMVSHFLLNYNSNGNFSTITKNDVAKEYLSNQPKYPTVLKRIRYFCFNRFNLYLIITSGSLYLREFWCVLENMVKSWWIFVKHFLINMCTEQSSFTNIWVSKNFIITVFHHVWSKDWQEPCNKTNYILLCIFIYWVIY